MQVTELGRRAPVRLPLPRTRRPTQAVWPLHPPGLPTEWVRADKRVVREAKKRRRVGRCLKVAEHELCHTCCECASRDMRVRDGPREMVKHMRSVCIVVKYARKADLECCVSTSASPPHPARTYDLPLSSPSPAILSLYTHVFKV
jgi:hypothetical protein